MREKTYQDGGYANERYRFFAVLHIRTSQGKFTLKTELDEFQTEMALEMVLNDVIQPKFKKFRGSFYNKAFRVLGYRGVGVTTGKDSTTYKEVKKTIDAFAEGKIPPQYAYTHLLSLKKVEEKKPEEPPAEAVDAAETPADSTASAANKDNAVN
jgi:hypothetical protein